MRTFRLIAMFFTVRFLAMLLLLVAMQQRAQAVDYYSSGSGEFSTIFPLAGLADGDRLFIQNGHTLTVNGVNDYSAINNVTIVIQSGGVLQLNDILGILNLGTGSSVTVEAGGQLTATGILGGFTTALTIEGGGVIPPAYSPLFGDSNPLNGPASVTASGTITLTQLYSISSGNWNTAGTWSTSSGGASCGCVPTATDVVIVENTHTINIAANSECGGLTILSGGLVQWSADASLTIRNSGNIVVEGSASLDENAQTNANLFLDNSAASSITSNGTIDLDALSYTTNAVPVHIVNTGTFNLNNDMLVGASSTLSNTGSMSFQSLNGNNVDFTFDNTGTVNMTGDFVNMAGAESINNKSGATWNYGGGLFDVATALYCDVDGANTFVYNRSGTQYMIVPQDSYWHLTLGGTGSKALSGNINIKGDFTITDGSLVTFDYSTFGVTLNGTTVQTLQFGSNNSSMSFYDLTANNTSGTIPAVIVTAATNLQINNSLTLTSGVIDVTGTTSGLYFPAGSSISPATGGSSTSYVDGAVTKAGTTAFTFPTGDGAIWAPIGISAPSTAGTEFTAQYFDAGYSSLTTDGTFSHVSASEYWTLSRANSTDAVNVTLHWKDDTRSEITDLADLRVARWDGSQWVSEGQNANSGTVTPAGWVQSNPVSNFSPFTFASQNGLNALPVTLTSFTGSQEGDMIQLRWQTASEINNDFFTLERSFDAKTFVPIGKVTGQGNTTEPTDYAFTDYPGVSGLVYYRLSQTDYDGTSETFDVISVNYELSTTGITAWPNPATDGRINIALPAPVKGKLTATLYAASGQVVLRQEIVNPDKTFSLYLPASSDHGLYLLQLDTQGSRTRIKLLVE